jgi:hypothetical protein
MNQLTPKHIKEIMLDCGNDWINQFPDDLRPQASSIYNDIQCHVSSVVNEVNKSYKGICNIQDRKQYATTVLRDYPQISHWLFAYNK